MSAAFPTLHRVPDILRRMDLNCAQAEAVKTCFNILAMMSKDEANKALITRDGIELILNAMTVHIDRTDVQAAGCDLLWSLAFNSSAVKEVIAKHGGAVVLVRALKRHSRSADFLKSACGALSNMCQSRLNQEGVALQGGLTPLVGAIHLHSTNGKLLPLLFDAIASAIVSNEENARTVSSLGIIPTVVDALDRHRNDPAVVKAGCHTLAILSDVRGQAAKISFAGGVPCLLRLLNVHPTHSDLHRVAVVVLLRMLQESAHVCREIAMHEGVRILLSSFEHCTTQQDTIAAVSHILATVTNPASPVFASIEPQLWLPGAGAGAGGGARGKCVSSRLHESPSNGQPSALGGVVLVLTQHSGRRDVVRAMCRLLHNLSPFSQVLEALQGLGVLEHVLECASIHQETRDVVEGAASLLKSLHRKGVANLSACSPLCLRGLLFLLRVKPNDEFCALACLDSLCLELAWGRAAKRDPEGQGWEPLARAGALGALRSALKRAGTGVGTEMGTGEAKGVGVRGTGVEERTALHSKVTGTAESGLLRMVVAVVGVLEAALAGMKLPLSASPAFILSPPRSVPTVPPLVSPSSSSSAPGFPTAASVSDSCEDGVEVLLAALHALPPSQFLLARRLEKLLLHRRMLGGQRSKKHARPPCHSGPGEAQDQEGPSPLQLSRRVSPKDEGQGRSRGVSSRVTSSMERGGSGSSGGKGWLASSNHGSTANLQAEYKQSEIDDNADAPPMHPLRQSIGDLLLGCPPYLERLEPPSRACINIPVNPLTRIHVVYESASAGGKGIPSRCPTPDIYPTESLGEPYPHSLTFDSNFESGNLQKAVQKGEASYDLFLRPDVHTEGYAQWFYFAVSNTHPATTTTNSTAHPTGSWRGPYNAQQPQSQSQAQAQAQAQPVSVTFHIVNFSKPDSLFSLGMRPVVYSQQEASGGAGWLRAGSDIAYYGNTHHRQGGGSYYTLQFTLTFQHPGDKVLVAYSYPYTLSDYRAHLSGIMERPGASEMIRQQRLCDTLGGEGCDLLVITNFADRDSRDRDRDKGDKDRERDRDRDRDRGDRDRDRGDRDRDKGGIGPLTQVQLDLPTEGNKASRYRNHLKPALFVSARVHPGETPASWVMQGMLDFLTSDSPQAQLMRHSFVIFVVPMLNPDGVVVGNNRCSLAGVDLNRQWKSPIKREHPTVHSLKQFMLGQRRVREVYMYLDLHGHSRKYNVFMYGCEDKKRPRPQVRAFPKSLSQHVMGSKYVSYADCCFSVKRDRESTARVVVAREVTPLSFTLEATYCGPSHGPLKDCHMNTSHLQEVGAALCDAVLLFAIAEGQVKETLPASIKAAGVGTGAEVGMGAGAVVGIEMGKVARAYGEAGSGSELDSQAHINLVGSSSSDGGGIGGGIGGDAGTMHVSEDLFAGRDEEEEGGEIGSGSDGSDGGGEDRGLEDADAGADIDVEQDGADASDGDSMGGEYVMGSGADIDIDVDSAPKRTGLPDMGRLTGVGGPLLPLNGLSAKSPRSPSHSPRSLRPSLSPISLSPLTLRSSPSASSPRSLRPSLAPSPLSRHLSPSSSCADVLSIGGSETAGEEDRDSDSDSDRVRDRDSEGGIAFLSSFLEGDETGLIPRKKSKKKRRGRKHTSLSSVSVASSPTSISSRKKHRDAVADASVKGGKVQAQGHGQAQMQVHGQVQGVAQGQAQRRRVRSASAGAWDDGKLDWHVKGTRAAAGAVLVEEDIFPGAEQRSPHNSGVLHLLGSSTYTDSPIGNNNTSTTTPAKALGLPRVPGAQS